jgi:hypothetical protein
VFEDVIARFDEYFERRHPSTTPESTAMVDRICATGCPEFPTFAADRGDRLSVLW